MQRKTRQIAFQTLRDMPRDELAARLSGPCEEAAVNIAAAARFGLVEAQVLFGQILLDGRGTPRDPAAAVLWFGAAASAGSADAMNMLGRCHEMGWGVRSDCAVAAVWYARAADHGLDWAQFNLANLTLCGRGVPQDRRKALSFYLSAARSGHAKSMNMIGRYCEEGWEVVRDTRRAVEWYRRGAEGGDFRAQYNLGTLLIREGQVAQAAVWLESAVRRGTQDFLMAIHAGMLRSDHQVIRVLGALAEARLHSRSGAPALQA